MVISSAHAAVAANIALTAKQIILLTLIFDYSTPHLLLYLACSRNARPLPSRLFRPCRLSRGSILSSNEEERRQISLGLLSRHSSLVTSL